MKPILHFTIVAITLTLALHGCIGVDILDDPIVEKKIEIFPGDTSILLNSPLKIQAIFYNEYGIQEMVNIGYDNSNMDVLTIDPDGNVTTISAGQTSIIAFFEETSSNTIQINVIETTTEVAQVIIQDSGQVLRLGERLNLTALIYNINGEEIIGEMVSWESEDPGIASVTNDGQVTGISNGITNIIASLNNIESAPYELFVGDVNRTTTFVGNAGYEGEGSATLSMQDDQIILDLEDDFMTSFALGTFVYLSNSTDGSVTRSNGLELGEITTNGAHTFNVTEIASSSGIEVKFYDYRYVIILCKPASITFAIGDFGE